MLNANIVEVIEELRGIVGQINGVTEIQERFCVEYIVLVKSDDDKANVEKVGQKLSEQANKFGFDVVITPATQKDLDEANDLLMKSQVTFKS
jgi:predicted amino acid-binding ACT domain protein